MKILYIITKSEAGGAQTHISQLTAFMKEKGHEVAVMAHPGGWLEDKTKELGGKFYPNNFLSNSYSPFLGLKVVKEVKKTIADFKPDLVSCHSSIAGVWGRWATKKRTPTIFTAHGWAFTQGVSPLRKFIAIQTERFMAKYSKQIICVSENDRQLALRYNIASEEKLVTIHNGVELNKSSEVENEDKKLEIIFVGRLSGQKDPELLLEAFSELSEETKSKSEIKIVGEGNKRNFIENLIIQNRLEDKVKLLGNLSREKVFGVLKEGDIFVLTSNYEGFPRSILEAMSCGLPAIASNVGGVREVVDQSVGYLVERGDKEGVKKALEELINNSDLRKEKGQNARERIEKDFSLDKMLNATYEIYKQVLNDKS